jgi:uncharacterized protein (TIGR02569 family)
MAAPPVEVMRAFGVLVDDVRPLPGGQQVAWTDGRLVLKPVGYPPEHAWVSEVCAAWTASDVIRVPEPVRPSPATWAEDSWTFDGWGAHVLVPGRDVDLVVEIHRVHEASVAFHEAVAGLVRPAFVDARDDPWSFGDRVAWEDVEPVGDDETLGLIARLRAAVVPVSAPDQVIHGDILGNVLVADGLPPAVIDWPPYYRPVGMANAIAATDAVTFNGAPLSLLDDWSDGHDWNQLLVRALLYRLATTGWFATRGRLRGVLSTHADDSCRVVDAVLARAA